MGDVAGRAAAGESASAIMSQDPRVSVIIAAFNAEDQIGRALDSACAQEGVDLEVVVADDASTDATVEVAAMHSSGRVKLVRLATNGGPSAARNAAIATAQGDWLAILDADDEMLPGRLAALVACAEATAADLVADNMLVKAGGTTRLFIEERLDQSFERIDLPLFAMNNRLFMPGLGYGYLKPVFRRRTLDRFELSYDEALRIGEDFMLVAELLARGAGYVRQRSAGYVYNRHSASTSHRLSTSAAEAMLGADQAFIERHQADLEPQARAAIARHLEALQDGVGYSRLLDEIKRRRLLPAARIAVKHPRALRHLRMPIQARLGRLKRSA